METPEAIAQKRLVRTLSSLMKSDEINLDEFNLLWDEPNNLIKFLKTYIPEITSLLSELTESVMGTLMDDIRMHVRAYIISLRVTNYSKTLNFSLPEFERALKLQKDARYQALLNVVYDKFDNVNHNMRVQFFVISNWSLFEVIMIVSNEYSYPDIVRYVKPLMKDTKFRERVLSCEESEELAGYFKIYLLMAVQIKNTIIFEAIIPSLKGKLVSFVREGDNFTLELSQEVTHKIRKEIAVSIDIIVPRKLKLKLVAEDELAFVGDLPWSRLASCGGFWIGSVARFRSLTLEERNEIKKKTGIGQSLEVKLNLAMKFFWALKLLGVVTDTINLSLSTLWWYFDESLAT